LKRVAFELWSIPPSIPDIRNHFGRLSLGSGPLASYRTTIDQSYRVHGERAKLFITDVPAQKMQSISFHITTLSPRTIQNP
jgi:hypothetical protein